MAVLDLRTQNPEAGEWSDFQATGYVGQHAPNREIFLTGHADVPGFASRVVIYFLVYHLSRQERLEVTVFLTSRQ